MPPRDTSETFAMLHGLCQQSILEKVLLRPVEARPPHRQRERDRLLGLIADVQDEVLHLCHHQQRARLAAAASTRARPDEDAGTTATYSKGRQQSPPGVPQSANEQANAFFTNESDLKPPGRVLLRGLRWRVLLGCLSRDCNAWRNSVARQRAEYAQLCERYGLHTTTTTSTKQTQQQKDHHSTAEEMERIRKSIHDDVLRTYPEEAYFQQADTREAMERVLLVFAHETPRLRYAQGMNEILAPLMYVLEQDSRSVHAVASGCRAEHIALTGTVDLGSGGGGDDDEKAPLAQEALWAILEEVAAVGAVEADAYSLFCCIMHVIWGWFVSPAATEHDVAEARIYNSQQRKKRLSAKHHFCKPPQEQPPSEGEGGGDEKVGGGTKELEHQEDHEAEKEEEEKEEVVEEARIVAKCLEIQKLLLAKDYELAVYLQQLGIQPQLYMLRWVRILLAQLFPLADLLPIWDALFASGAPFPLLDHLCVVLLALVRADLLASDYAGALNLLFHYPVAANSPYLVVAVALGSLRSRINPLFVPSTLLPPTGLRYPALFPRARAPPPPPALALPATSASSSPKPHARRATIHFGRTQATASPSPTPPAPPAQPPAQPPAPTDEGAAVAVAATPRKRRNSGSSSTTTTTTTTPPPKTPPFMRFKKRAAKKDQLDEVLATNVHVAERLERLALMLSSIDTHGDDGLMEALASAAKEAESIRGVLATTRTPD